MVKRDRADSKDLSNIILLHFDWAGEVSSARYPSNVLCIIWRLSSVKYGSLINPTHDDLMLEHLDCEAQE